MESETFQKLLQRLLTNWKTDESRAKVITKEFKAIFDEVGQARFSTAVDDIIRQNPYTLFPTQAEFRGYLPPVEKKPTCGKCKNGWIMVPDYQARKLYKNEIAMCTLRCECRRGPKFEAYEKRVKAWTAPS